MNNLKDIHNLSCAFPRVILLFYQDFNEQFEGYTQRNRLQWEWANRCFIRISMNNLKDIHNRRLDVLTDYSLFYQDFNEQFEGYTQPALQHP